MGSPRLIKVKDYTKPSANQLPSVASIEKVGNVPFERSDRKNDIVAFHGKVRFGRTVQVLLDGANGPAASLAVIFDEPLR